MIGVRVDTTARWDSPDVVGDGPGPAFVVCVGDYPVTRRERGQTVWLAYASKRGAELGAQRARAVLGQQRPVMVRCHDPANPPEEEL